MSLPSPAISVALCTYNGAAFVEEQLASLAAQTLMPIEAVVCDDASTDRTVEIVNRFAAGAPFPVRVHVQPTNLGWRANRQDCYQRCTGDWIAVCDQDDVWKPQKLQRMAAADRAMVFCDAEVVDQQLRTLGYTSWQIHGLDSARQTAIAGGDALAAMLSHTPISDACLMFRADLLRLALPLPDEWLPDAWMVIVAAATGGCALVPEPLQLYRQHSTNQLGGGRKSVWTKYAEARRAVSADSFARQERQYELLRDRVAPAASSAAIAQIAARLAFASVRRQMREQPWLRPWLVLNEFARGSYRRYGSGWRSIALDLLV